MPDTSDAQLVSACRSGDQEAYKELVTRYQGHVYGLAYSLVDDWAEAQDLAQETFIRAYTNLDQLREPARFAAWLRRVTFSVTMDWLRTFRPGVFRHLDGKIDLDALDIPSFEPGPAETAQKRELADAVLAAVATLPHKYRVPLTMFHLDGLSYQKVADFLDIPLGTAKSMIHRARAKLKDALAVYATEEVTPMVQEVFNEHKLPAEFASKVLAGVPRLTWGRWECPWCGPVTAYLEYTGAGVPYEYVMGVSGSAFKLLWHRTWCPSNNSAGMIPGLTDRTFRILGYETRSVNKPASQDQFRRAIMDSINAGEPVLGGPIMATPDADIIAGYERDGEVLLGHSYFHDGSKGYFRKSDWYEGIWYIIVIGARKQPPTQEQVLRESINWAVKLARTPKMVEGRATGLAAYIAWAAALLKDEDFPSSDLDALTRRCNVSTSVTLSGLHDSRRAATAFLKIIADVTPAIREHMLAAAEAYAGEVEILKDMLDYAPFCFGPRGTEEMRLSIAERSLRQRLADGILTAHAKDEQAIQHLEAAIREMTQ